MAQARIWPTETDSQQQEAIRAASQALLAGEIVALPTETVYGLAVLRDDVAGHTELVRVKGRPDGKPFTEVLAAPSDAARLYSPVPDRALRLIEAYWPGPLTLVLTRPGGSTVGLRCPGHDLTRSILSEVGKPVVMTSANISGEKEATTAAEVQETFSEKIGTIVDGGAAGLGQASTVVGFDEAGCWSILRPGILDEESLARRTSPLFLFVCTGNTCRSPMAEAIARRLLSDHLKVQPEDLERCGYRLRSAGLFALDGAPASEHARTAAKELGADLSSHKSRRVLVEEVLEAEKVFAMTEGHRDGVLSLIPGGEAAVVLLDPQGNDLGDPYGGSLAEYRGCAKAITQALKVQLGL